MGNHMVCQLWNEIRPMNGSLMVSVQYKEEYLGLHRDITISGDILQRSQRKANLRTDKDGFRDCGSTGN